MVAGGDWDRSGVGMLVVGETLALAGWLAGERVCVCAIPNSEAERENFEAIALVRSTLACLLAYQLASQRWLRHAHRAVYF